MIVENIYSDFSRKPGDRFHLVFHVGQRVIRLRRVLWVRNEKGEPAWEPIDQLRVSDSKSKKTRAAAAISNIRSKRMPVAVNRMMRGSEDR